MEECMSITKTGQVCEDEEAKMFGATRTYPFKHKGYHKPEGPTSSSTMKMLSTRHQRSVVSGSACLTSEPQSTGQGLCTRGCSRCACRGLRSDRAHPQEELPQHHPPVCPAGMLPQVLVHGCQWVQGWTAGWCTPGSHRPAHKGSTAPSDPLGA